MDDFCGRKTELGKLGRAYSRVKKGKPGAVVISGPAGCGKTTLVIRFALEVERDGGFFVHGKADTASKSRPFSTTAAALDMLVKKAIAETPGGHQGLKQEIHAVTPKTGHSLPRLFSLVPALSYLFEKQPSLTFGHGPGDIASVNLLLLSLLEVFAAVLKRPIVLFLDDLQWLDTASHGFLRYLVMNPPPAGFLLVMAHRSDDPDICRNIGETTRLYSGLASTRLLSLSGLTRRDTRKFLARCLASGPKLLPLADLCHEKTAGNPLYLGRLVEELLEKGILHRKNGEWTYDITHISGLSFTENVADLIIGRITLLGKEALDLLKQAACIREKIGVNLLAAVSGHPQEKIDALLWKPVQQNLLRKTRDGYAFAHDKILESVAALLEGEQARRIHQRLAAHYLAAHRRGDPESDIFTLLYHYGFCRSADTDPSGQKEMAEVYFQAGEKALEQSAYELALGYFTRGKAHFPGDIWSQAYDLALRFCGRIARCAYLAGDFDTAGEAFGEVDANAGTFGDRMDTELLKISCYQAGHREAEAFAVGMDMLRRLGFPISEHPSRRATLMAILTALGRFIISPKGRLTRRQIDPGSDACVALRCLSALGPIAYYLSSEGLLPMVITKAFTLSLKHGNTGETPNAYIGFGMILNEITGGIGWGRRLGAMAREISREYSGALHRVREQTGCNIFLDHWDKPLAQSVRDFEATEILCLKQGDHEYFGYNATGALQCMIIGGTPLPEAARRAAEKKRVLARINNLLALTTAGFMQQAVENLLQGVPRPWILNGAHFGEHLVDDGPASLFAEFYFYKLLTAVYCGRMDKALEIKETLNTCDKVAFDVYQWNTYQFLCALLDIHRQAGKKQMRRHLKTLKKFAARNDAIYKSKYLLILGETRRLAGRPGAARTYRDAGAAAECHGLLFEQALALEGLSKTAEAAGDGKAAQVYAGQAAGILKAWGLVWRHGLFDDRKMGAAVPGALAVPGPQTPGQGSGGPGGKASSGTSPEEARINEAMERLQQVSGATAVHAAVKIGQAWKSLVYINGQGIHRPQTFVTLPERMLSFSAATNEVVRTDKDGTEPTFFDAAYFWEKQPSSLMVVPAGKGRGACFENCLPSLVQEEVIRLVGELFALLSVPDTGQGRYPGNDAVDAVVLKRNCGKILSCMSKSGAYKNPKLNLAGFSRAAGMSPRAVADAINICLGQNFRTFVNSYRVEAVKQAMLHPENREKTILEIAYAQGFNSKSTFNEVFKQNVGMTPSRFMKGRN